MKEIYVVECIPRLEARNEEDRLLERSYLRGSQVRICTITVSSVKTDMDLD